MFAFVMEEMKESFRASWIPQKITSLSHATETPQDKGYYRYLRLNRYTTGKLLSKCNRKVRRDVEDSTGSFACVLASGRLHAKSMPIQ